MTRTSRIAVLLVVGHGAASTGCTLVSGWSDLQDGNAASHVDAGVDGGGDSGSGQTLGHDSGSSEDSGVPDASSIPMGVLCGGTSRCAVACCEGIVGESATCVTSAQMCSVPNAYLTCSDSSQCTVTLGHAAQCCAENPDDGTAGSTCRTTCAAGSSVVCDPTLETPTCPSGQSCLPDEADGYSYDTCQ